jgi:hypothetical protein
MLFRTCFGGRQCVPSEIIIPTDAKFCPQTTPNGVSLWFEPVKSKTSATAAVGSASYSFSGKQDNQPKSAEVTSYTELVDRKRAYSLTYKYSHYS